MSSSIPQASRTEAVSRTRQSNIKNGHLTFGSLYDTNPIQRYSLCQSISCNPMKTHVRTQSTSTNASNYSNSSCDTNFSDIFDNGFGIENVLSLSDLLSNTKEDSQIINENEIDDNDDNNTSGHVTTSDFEFGTYNTDDTDDTDDDDEDRFIIDDGVDIDGYDFEDDKQIDNNTVLIQFKSNPNVEIRQAFGVIKNNETKPHTQNKHDKTDKKEKLKFGKVNKNSKNLKKKRRNKQNKLDYDSDESVSLETHADDDVMITFMDRHNYNNLSNNIDIDNDNDSEYCPNINDYQFTLAPMAANRDAVNRRCRRTLIQQAPIPIAALSDNL